MSNFEKNLEQALINAKRLTDKILIDGKLISAQSKNKIPVLNPSTGENIGSAPQCDKNDVNTAVESSPEMNVATLLDASPSIIVESI